MTLVPAEAGVFVFPSITYPHLTTKDKRTKVVTRCAESPATRSVHFSAATAAAAQVLWCS